MGPVAPFCEAPREVWATPNPNTEREITPNVNTLLTRIMAAFLSAAELTKRWALERLVNVPEYYHNVAELDYKPVSRQISRWLPMR